MPQVQAIVAVVHLQFQEKKWPRLNSATISICKKDIHSDQFNTPEQVLLILKQVHSLRTLR
jgi:hypothetical protein